MHDTPARFLNLEQRALREQLARMPREVAPPFDFAELQRRALARAPVRRASSRYVGIAAALLGVLTGGLLWQSFAPTAIDVPRVAIAGDTTESAAAAAAAATATATATATAPALVRVATRAAASDIEERIAWMDDLLSESRVQGSSSGNLAALERNRTQLMTSLRKVRYAEQLMNQ